MGETSGQSSGMLDDQPSPTDLLGFSPYASTLEDILLSPDAKTPFIVGVFGRWGSGKTTLLQLLKSRLDARGAATVWFGAWLYSQEKEIWAALLQSVSTQVFARLRPIDKLRFSLDMYLRGLAWERLAMGAPQLLVRLAMILAPVAVAAIAAASVPALRDAAAALGVAGVAGSAVVAWQLLKPALDKASTSLLPTISLSRAIDFEQHVGVLERFREQFGRMVKALPTTHSRLTVFVDDLDRCEPTKALQVLDAIKVFLDLPGCTFVLGLDIAVVQKAIDQKYDGDPVARREYLGKIIQLVFHLPTPTPGHLKDYLGRLEVSFPDSRCSEIFLTSLAANPREIKRVINSYGFSWRLALTQGLAAITPVRLAKVVVIQQAYDRLFALLKERPEWLPILERAFLARTATPPPVAPPQFPPPMPAATVAVTVMATVVMAPVAPPPPMPQPPQQSAAPPAPEPTTVWSAATVVAAPAPQALGQDATVFWNPRGVAIPPALETFLEDPALERLLTAHVEDEGFSELQPDDVAVYFNFAAQETRRAALGDGVTMFGPAGPRPDDLPSFGAYRVLSRLGAGGISEVFLAEDPVLNRRVAIKRLHSTLASDPRWIQRFEREIALLSKVSAHPNIVSIFDRGVTVDDDGRPSVYYVMEANAGRTLDEILAQHPFSPADLKACALPLLDGLDHVHRAGIVHGDIKPNSIVISPTGEPKLIDFGLAFAAEDGRDNLTSTGTVLATLGYASPEQLRGGQVDARSDLYSLGAVLYECVCGRKPFGTDSEGLARRLSAAPEAPSQAGLPYGDWSPSMQAGLDDVLTTLLQPDPRQRFASAREARAALQRALRAEA